MRAVGYGNGRPAETLVNHLAGSSTRSDHYTATLWFGSYVAMVQATWQTGTGRRTLISAAAGLATLASVLDRKTASAGPPGPARLDLSAPATRLRAFMLMRGALDDRLVIGFVLGAYYGVIHDEIKPLYGVMGATFTRYRPMPGGGYEGVSSEQAYFTDLETGQVLDRWHNPYTGEVVQVPNRSPPAGKLRIGDDLQLAFPTSGPAFASTDHHVLAPQIVGNDLWMVERTIASVTDHHQAAPRHFNELITLHANLTDLQKPHALRVPCDTSYQAVLSWRPWMKMGSLEGHILGNGAGRYGATLDTLPAAWTEATQARNPGLLKNPQAALEPLWQGVTPVSGG